MPDVAVLALQSLDPLALVRRRPGALALVALGRAHPVAERLARAADLGRDRLVCTPHAMARLLGQIGFVSKKPKCVPAKAGALVQQACLDAILRTLMRAAGPETALLRGWLPPLRCGMPRPRLDPARSHRRVEVQSWRTRLNLNGALSWPEPSLIHHQEERITSAAMIRLFETLAAHHPAAETVTVVLDNARYNRSRELKAWLDRPGCRVRLVYLPS